MFKALVDLRDFIFKPINAFFSKLTGGAPPLQGGNVIDRALVAPVGQGEVRRLLERLPIFAEIGAPTPLTKLLVPPTQLSIPTGAAPILRVANEFEKPSWADLREV